LPGTGQFTFDSFTQLGSAANGDTIFFSGPNVVAAYGGDAPVTAGNYSHVGNNPSRAGVVLFITLRLASSLPTGENV
jgi:hypothetical protein